MAKGTGSSILDVVDRERMRHGVSGRVRTDEVLRAAGHQVHIKTLRAAEGGLEACVLPLTDGRYRFVCDDAASPDEPPDIAGLHDPRQFRVSFRLAHELAHTALGLVAFGTHRGSHATSAVEARCDEFAALFLVDRAAARHAVNTGELVLQAFASELDLPPRLVRDAAKSVA
jgi:hypothetical protein